MEQSQAKGCCRNAMYPHKPRLGTPAVLAKTYHSLRRHRQYAGVAQGVGSSPCLQNLGQNKTHFPEYNIFRSLRHDNKISRQYHLHFQYFIVVAFPTKNSVLDDFSSLPQSPPPSKLQILFLLLSSRRL